MGSLDGVGGEMFDVVPEVGRTAILVTFSIPRPVISYGPHDLSDGIQPQRFEITLRHSPFLFGDSPVYGDFLLSGICGNLTYRGSNPLTPEQSALAKFASTLNSYRY